MSHRRHPLAHGMHWYVDVTSTTPSAVYNAMCSQLRQNHGPWQTHVQMRAKSHGTKVPCTPARTGLNNAATSGVLHSFRNWTPTEGRISSHSSAPMAHGHHQRLRQPQTLPMYFTEIALLVRLVVTGFNTTHCTELALNIPQQYTPTASAMQ